MSTWIDISRSLDDRLLCWPGRTPPNCTWEKRIAGGAHCNVSTWTFNAHTGTHVDAPLHFIESGLPIDQIPPDTLIGDCLVLNAGQRCQGVLLDEEAIENCRGTDRLIVRTAHSDLKPGEAYPPHGALLTPAAARRLVEAGLKLIGTDRLSVDGTDGVDFSIHHMLLGAGCVIVEGLALAGIDPGDYTLCVLPLRLKGAEASPARALLARSAMSGPSRLP